MHDPREIAKKIILGRTSDIEYLTIVEQMPDNLTEDEQDELASKVAASISSATITVEWPGEDHPHA